VLWGEIDPLIEVAGAHKFADAIPGAKLIVYPKVGHLPQVEIPQRSADDAAAFLAAAGIQVAGARRASRPSRVPSMRSDYLGNPVSLTSDAAVAAVDRFVEAFLSYEASAAEIIAAADAHPSSALLNSYAAMLWLLLEGARGSRLGLALSVARPRSGESSPSARTMDRRFVVAWFGDDIPEALSIADSILKAWPRDLLILKMRQYHDFNRGDFPAMLKAAVNVAPAADDVPQLHGMLAFAYEQCHLLDEAEAAARRALALKRKEPWAQHALAHVMLTQGRIDEGVAFLEGVRDTWTGLNSFMDTHLWWHLALFYLSQGRFEDALAAYDDHCWAQAKDYSQDQIGAVSLLARLEAGGRRGRRPLDRLADHLVSRADDVVQPFLTLQYLYGLARAGRARGRYPASRRAPRGAGRARLRSRDLARGRPARGGGSGRPRARRSRSRRYAACAPPSPE
jgi:tetratricopeptide (TPR) repeat protein